MKVKDGTYDNNTKIIKIIDTYYKDIFNYCYILLDKNKEDAEECTQEIFIIMLIKWENLSNFNNIRAWLYRVSDNVIRNYKRKVNRNNAELQVWNTVEYSKNLVHNDDTGIFDILSILKEAERQLIVEYYINKGTAKELSKEYNVSESAIFMRIHRIKERLRNIYFGEFKVK